MKAKKALKKLYKKASAKSQSVSVLQLKNLRNSDSPPPISDRKCVINPETKHEIQALAEQVAINALSEIAKPLNPIISWLNDTTNTEHTLGQYKQTANQHQQAANQHQQTTNQRTANASGLSSFHNHRTLSNVTSIGRMPLKSPPCKRCPALQNGLCKCAAKKFQLTA